MTNSNSRRQFLYFLLDIHLKGYIDTYSIDKNSRCKVLMSNLVLLSLTETPIFAGKYYYIYYIETVYHGI